MSNKLIDGQADRRALARCGREKCWQGVAEKRVTQHREKSYLKPETSCYQSHD